MHLHVPLNDKGEKGMNDKKNFWENLDSNEKPREVNEES